MENREFRVWCHNKNEWENDTVSLLPSGELIHPYCKTLKKETHTLEFYIGIKDKNAIKIFEGDIIKRKTKSSCCGKIIYEEIQTVKWEDTGFYGFSDDVGGSCGFANIENEEIEVIGHIHKGK